MNKANLKIKLDDALPRWTLRDLLTPVFRHKGLVSAVFAAIFLFSVFVAWTWAAKYYVASMQIVVQQHRSDPTITPAQTAAVMNNRGISPDQISSEMALLKGEDMLRSVVETCGLVNQDKWSVSEVLQRPAGSSRFFEEQTAKYGKDLADVETRLANFSRDEGVAAPDVLRTDLAQQLSVSMASLYQAQQAVAADEERLKDLEKQIRATPERITTQQISNSALTLMQQLEANLLAAEVKRTQLLVKYDPSYPLVVETDEEIANTKKAIEKAKSLSYMNETTDHNPTYEYLHQDYARTQADLASQKANATSIAASLKTMHAQMVGLDSSSLKQGALLREAKANEANYLLYLNKREQERASDALDEKRIADVAIAVPAIPPALPANNPLLVGVGGFVFAMLAGISAGLIAERLDPSFRTPVDVTETLRIPVLASVPRQAA